MKITLSNNIDNIGCAIEGLKDEMLGMAKKDSYLQIIAQQAGEAALDIFKRYPAIKQVTFDTMTNEERDMIDRAESLAEKGGSS